MKISGFSPLKVIQKFAGPTARLAVLHLGNESRTRVSLFNPGTEAHTFSIEPWGADYTISARERIELVAFGDQTEPSFELTTDYEHSTQVWCNEANTYEVLQDGIAMECGHNRHLTTSNASQESPSK